MAGSSREHKRRSAKLGNPLTCRNRGIAGRVRGMEVFPEEVWMSRAPWTVTAFFDERSAADRAVSGLLEAGFFTDAVRLVPGAERDEGEGARAGGLDPHPARVGFFDAIGDLLLPDGDRWAYAEGLRRGGFLVSVHCADVEHDRILDQEGTLDLD
jgi:hypothetical protein